MEDPTQANHAAPSLSEDVDLVQRARAGEASAIGEIGKRLERLPRLIAVANQRMSTSLPAHEVADVAQDTFLTIWEKLETYQGKGTLEGWAWNVGINHLRNRVRKVSRLRHYAGAALEDVHAAPPDSHESMPYDPDEIEAALDELPAEMAEVIRLKHDDGLMFKEIGARLRIAESTAKTRYYRGLIRMREVLTHGGPRGLGSQSSQTGESA